MKSTMVHTTVLISLLFAAWAAAFPYSSDILQKRCVPGTSSWTPNAQGWANASTDAWITTWWNDQSLQNKSAMGFSTLIGQAYLPTDPSWRCAINSICEITDCEQIASITPNDPAPYFVMLSLEYFTQQMTFYYNGLIAAISVDSANEVNFASTFSNGPPTDNSGLILREILSLINYSIYAGLAALEPIAIVNVIGTLIVGGISESSNLIPSTDPSQYTFQRLEIYGNFLSQFLSVGIQSINNMTSNLLFGLADPAGFYIWDWFKEASFASLSLEPANGPNANFTEQFALDFIGTIATAGGINALWKASNVYIVSSPSSDCASDNRVPSDLKFCREDVLDGNVYGIYTISGNSVQSPPGYNKLNTFAFNNISLNDVMLSSVKAYQAAKFNYANVQAERWSASLQWGIGNRPIDQWAYFEGVFTIPVCIDLEGSALTQTGSTSFPCSCGGDNGDETGPFRAASQLEENQDYLNQCGQFNSNDQAGPPGSPTN